MQRPRNNAVTDIPVLIPCGRKEEQGLATFLGEAGETYQPVRALTDADFRPESESYPLRAIWGAESDLFCALVALLKGLQAKDQLAITRARDKLVAAIGRQHGTSLDADLVQLVGSSILGLRPGQAEKIALDLSTLGPRSSADVKWLLSTQVSEALDSVRLVLWWSGAQFRPALYCPNLKSALYTFFLLKTVAGRGWGVCPFCGLFFVQTRSDQNYCSIAHREAHRVARWRAKKVLKSKKKKKRRKNVTRKTR